MTTLPRPAGTDTFGTPGFFLDEVLDAYADLIEANEAAVTAALPKAGGTLTGDLVVPDEAYDATAWNGSLEVPTKNAVRDKIESLVTTSTARVRKSANESVTSSTTLQNDDELLFPIAASEVWAATFVIFYVGNATGDFKLEVTGPSGSTIQAGGVIYSTADAFAADAGGGSGTSGTFTIGASTSQRMAVIHVSVLNSTTAGNVQLRWAQNTSDATATTVKAGSFLTAAKVA